MPYALNDQLPLPGRNHLPPAAQDTYHAAIHTWEWSYSWRVMFRSAVRENVLRGARQLADAVHVTLGPKSKSVLVIGDQSADMRHMEARLSPRHFLGVVPTIQHAIGRVPLNDLSICRPTGSGRR